MALQGSVVLVLLTLSSLAAAEEAVALSGSYAAPPPSQPDYQAPVAEYAAPQYSAPQQQYSAPQQQYSAPQQQYSAPQQQYSAPQQQYSAPQQQYSAPQQQYSAPQQQYSQSHAGYDSYQQDNMSLFAKGGGSFLKKFGHDWIFAGILVASFVILLAIIGVVVVPGLPFTGGVMPAITALFKDQSAVVLGRSLAQSALSSGLLGEMQLGDVADAVNYVETSIARARRFIADFPQ